MIVVLDANVIVADFRLNAPSSRLLIENLTQTGHKLAVPELVIQEVVNKFSEKVAADVCRLLKLSQSLSRKLGEPVAAGVLPIQVPQHAAAYEEFLRNKLQEHGAMVPDFPNVSHESVVRRALDRRKPFSPDGRRGYRDALIWESIRRLAKSEGGKVAFITMNEADFAGENKELHNDLRADLATDELAEDSVTLFLRTDDFLDRHVIPGLPPAEQTIAKLQKAGPQGFDLEVAVDEAVDRDRPVLRGRGDELWIQPPDRV